MRAMTRRSMALASLALAAAFGAQAQETVTGAQVLKQILDKRDMLRNVELKTAPKIRIGQDALEFTVKSGKQGFVYVLLAGADNKTVTLLFPNRVDSNNRIAPGQELKLPRPSWPLKSAGPAGVNTLLVVVADGPREFSSLTLDGPFGSVQNNADGRGRLLAHVARSSAAGSSMCLSTAVTKNDPICSSAYAAAIATVEEVQ
jgi:hypothetical protein